MFRWCQLYRDPDKIDIRDDDVVEFEYHFPPAAVERRTGIGKCHNGTKDFLIPSHGISRLDKSGYVIGDQTTHLT